MQRSVLLSMLMVCATCGSSVGTGWAHERSSRISRGEEAEVAIHYDLYLVEDGNVSDASGNSFSGKIHQGEIIFGRNKNAIKLDGDGWIAMASVPAEVDLGSRSFTVGAYCRPAARDGVLISMGDQTSGFSLYLKDSLPHFVIRTSGKLLEIAGKDPVELNQWIHLAGAIDSRGKLWLIVNTWPAGDTSGKPLEITPTEPFCVGADLGSRVGSYTTPMYWNGLIQDIRLYRGFLDRNENRDQWQD